MKKQLLLFVIALCSALAVPAQNSFINVYGGVHFEQGSSIERFQTGGFVIGGFCNDGFGRNDVSLTKVDENGNLQWCKKYGTPLNDRFCDIALTSSKECYILCDMRDPQNNGVTVIKTDSMGNAIWCRVYNDIWSSWGLEIESTSDGGFVMTCQVDTLATQGWYCYKVVRCNSSGAIRFSKMFPAGTTLYSILPCSNGDIIVGGSSLVRMDSTGNVLYSRIYSGLQQEVVCDLIWYNNDMLVLWYEVDTSMGPYYFAMTVGKIDSNGNVLWSRRMDAGHSFLWNKKLSASSSGIITITANTTDTVSSSGVLIQLDSADNLLGSYVMTSGSIYFSDVIATSASECVITGSIEGSFAPTDSSSTLLIRMSPDELICGMTTLPVTSRSDTITYQNHTLSNYNSGWSVVAYYPSIAGSAMMNLCAVGVNEVQEQPFNIFPVPLQSEFVVSGKNLTGSEFLLMDAQGRVVKRTRLNSDRTVIGCDELSTGLYLFEIVSANGEITRTGKLLRN